MYNENRVDIDRKIFQTKRKKRQYARMDNKINNLATLVYRSKYYRYDIIFLSNV